MKNSAIVYLFLLFFFVGFLPSLSGQNCSLEVNTETLDIDGNTLDIQPGETVCILSGQKDYLLIQNVHGTAANPVTFVNKNGAVIINTDHYYGIKLAHCSFIKIIGNGTDGITYGFQVQRVANGAGISVGELSTNVEIAFVEVSNTEIAGVYAKTDPTCNDFSSTRDKFTMYNFWFHDCYVHNTGDEGLYIGSSKYTGQHLTGDCDTVVFPHVLIGTKIYNNIIENTGWDGIQVSSAESNCSIHDNIVRFDSQAKYPGQMSGILLGGGSKCKTYNNKIFDGNGDGIEILGLGNHEVFNNLIVRAGVTYYPDNTNKFKHGIYVGKVVTDEGASLGIYNNTIVKPKSFGITLANSDFSNIYVINNIITAPGQFPVVGNNAFINDNVGGSVMENHNNFLNYATSAAKFIDDSSDNFDLKPYSPAVNAGFDLTSQGVSFDILNRFRPFHTFFDEGAFESHDPNANIKTYTNDFTHLDVYPNPFSKSFNIVFVTNKKLLVTIELYNFSGQLILNKKQYCFANLKCAMTIKTEKLPVANYLLKLSSIDNVEKIIILHKNKMF